MMSKTIYRCGDCHHECNNEATLLLHHAETHAQRNHQYKCYYCNLTFDLPGELLEHTTAVHEVPDVRFACAVCARKSFALLNNLTKHIEDLHGRATNTCAYCGAQCANVAAFKSHVLKHVTIHDETISVGNKKKQVTVIRGKDVPYRELIKGKRTRGGSHSGETEAKRINLERAVELSSKDVDSVTGRSASLGKAAVDEPTASHSLRSHKVSAEAHSCKQCHRSFFLLSNLAKHMEIHSSKPFSCTNCSKAFAQQDQLDAHCDRAHAGMGTEMKDKGVEDQREFLQAAMMEIQDELEQAEGELINENDQGQETDEQSQRMLQVVKVESDIEQDQDIEQELVGPNEQLKCSYCNKIFPNKTLIQQHRLTHSNMRFHCPLCERSFMYRSNLQRHVREHTSVMHICPHCPKQFLREEQLNSHVDNFHMATKEVEKHICQDCGQKFTNRTNLRTHELIHEDLKPHVCAQCSRAFRQKSHLEVHLRTHTGEKPFPCSQCDYTARTREQLLQHLSSTHHENIKYRYQCAKCEDNFATKGELKAHAELHSCGLKFIPTASDDACDKELGRLLIGIKGEEERHVHWERFLRQFQCDQCEEDVYAIFQEHRNSHFDRKQFHPNYKDVDVGRKFRKPVTVLVKPKTNDVEQLISEVEPHMSQPESEDEDMMGGDGEEEVMEDDGLCTMVTDDSTKNERQVVVISITENRFPCRVCKISFMSGEQLNRHKLDVHAKHMHSVEGLTCSACSLKFKRRGELNRHLWTAHRLKPFECHICNKTFSAATNFSRHMGAHEGRANRYGCPLCPKTFSRRETVSGHIRRRHHWSKPEGGEGEWEKPRPRKRGRKPKGKENLEDAEIGEKGERIIKVELQEAIGGETYDQEETGEDDPISVSGICTHCDARFPTAYLLRVHVNKVHGDLMVFACAHCEMSFPSSRLLTQHEHTHGEVRYQCPLAPECLKTFRHKTNLTRHIKLHQDDKAHMCSYCDRSFARRYELEQHVGKIHFGIEADRWFECNICARRFQTLGGLKMHMLAHTGERPFPCQDCTRTFKQKSHLQVHSLKHSGLKLFQCTECDYEANDGRQLRKHMMRHNIEWTKSRYQCPFCLDSFPVKADLREHLQLHQDRQEVLLDGQVLEGEVLEVHEVPREIFVACEGDDIGLESEVGGEEVLVKEEQTIELFSLQEEST